MPAVQILKTTAPTRKVLLGIAGHSICNSTLGLQVSKNPDLKTHFLNTDRTEASFY